MFAKRTLNAQQVSTGQQMLISRGSGGVTLFEVGNR